LAREFVDVTADCFKVRKDGKIEFDIIGQSNHGVCVVAMDPWVAYEHIERLDYICEIALKSGVGYQGEFVRLFLPESERPWR
jgi:L-fuculose-phosphate aldolase